jgi:dihydrolipoamide dehydrogenase
MDKNKITVLEGLGSFVDTHVAIAKPMELSKQLKQKYNYNGSKPQFPFIKIDKERIITSTALKLKEVPKHLVIIGGGVIELN